MSDAGYVSVPEQSFEYAGKPFAPAHLKAQSQATGDLEVTWIPRVAGAGESWSGPISIPFASYRVQVLRSAQLLREVEVETNNWTYTAAAQAADGFALGDEIAIAAIGEGVGYGFETRIIFNG